MLKGQRLKLVVYFAEVTPGRELLPYNDKEIWAFYWSFLDFGPAVLANEDAWFTGLVVRSCTIKNKVAGGMAQVFKVYMNMFFNLADGCDFRKGVGLNVESAPAPAASAPAAAASAQGRSLVFVDLAMVVQDAEAHALAFGWRGASSMKCCPLCVNIVSKHCNLVRDPTRGHDPSLHHGHESLPADVRQNIQLNAASAESACPAPPKGAKCERTRLRIQMGSGQLAPRHRARRATDAGARI